jgi:uncharacterized protein (DUF2164 family)
VLVNREGDIELFTLKKLSKEKKDVVISNIQDFFYKSYDLDLSSAEADRAFDFMVKEIGPHAYNRAIEDARKTAGNQFALLEEELYVLQVPDTPSRS